MVRTGILASPLAWTIYVALPASGWGWLDGLPLGPLEAVVIALVWWTWSENRQLPGLRVLVALTLAKILLGSVFVDRGFAARYYANDQWAPPVERSIEFRDETITRHDERLSFGAGPNPDLPLHFLNDLRFNFYLPSDPQRDLLAHSVVWGGFLQSDDASLPVTFYLTGGEGVSGELLIDGRQLLALDGASGTTGSTTLPDGWHGLTVKVAAPYGSRRQVEAGEIVDGVRRPFDGNRVLVAPVGQLRRASDMALRWATRAIDAVMLSWLAVLVAMRIAAAWRAGSFGRLLWVAGTIEALRFALPHASRVTMLSGGNDWLAYESFARAIALGDPLLREPAFGGGQGGPFYFQPLYPYFVALAHLAFGDSLFGVILLQRLLVVVTIGCVMAMTARLFGARAGWIALVGGGLFLYEKAGTWADVLLAEPLFMALLAAWIWVLVKIATGVRSWPHVLFAGAIGGLATLTRSTLLLGWPLILPLWWASFRPRRTRYVAVLLAVMVVVVGMATLRNWIVARTFVPVTTSFGINLYLGNEPPRPLPPPTAGRARVYEQLGLESYTRTVVEYALQAPREFWHNLGRKAVFSVGFFERSGIPGLPGTSWSYVGMWVLALCGVIRMWRTPPVEPSAALSLPGAAALSHFMAVVLIFPDGYGDRLIVPLYPLLIPYAAFALESLVKTMQPHASRIAPVLQSLAVRLALVAGRRPAIGRRAWLYIGLSAALVQRCIWPPDDLDRIYVAQAFLLPSVAFAVAQLTRKNAIHRVVSGAVFVAALLRVAMAGSLSPEALHDPLFWGVIAVAAAGISAMTLRWPPVAAGSAALAGGFTVAAVLLPSVIGFSFDVVRDFLATLTRHAGVIGMLCLLGLWIQAILSGWTRTRESRQTGAAASGALLAALLLSLAGAPPLEAGRMSDSIIGLAILLGLAETGPRQSAPSTPRRSLNRMPRSAPPSQATTT